MTERASYPVAAWAGRIGLAAASFTFALVVAEVGLRLLLPASPAVEDDGRYGFIAYDERLGWAPVPNASGRITSSEFDVAVTLNGQGLRGERAYPVARRQGVPRIVLVGDSFSFGYGVTHEATWVTRLERSLDPIDVINLSVSGYGTDQQLLRLEDEGLAFRPDLVILALFEGNVFRNARDQQVGFPKPRFVLEGDRELRLTGIPVPRETPEAGLLARTALARVAGRPVGEVWEHLGGGSAWPVTRAIVARAQAATAASGAAFLVVVIPKDQAVHGKGVRRWLHERTLATIGAMLDDLGVEHIDLTPSLAAQGREKRLYFYSDGHWNATGHAVAASVVAERLRGMPALMASRRAGRVEPREGERGNDG